MLTFKAEVLKSKQKSDGTYNVKIRMTYNREVKRLSTNIFVRQEDLTKSFKLKNPKFIKEADTIVRYYQEVCARLQLDINHYTLDDIIAHLKGEQIKSQEIDFIQFSREWITHATIKGAENYTTAINALVAFLGQEELKISQLTKGLLERFASYINARREVKVKELIRQGKRVPSNRALSLYLGSIRHLFNEAKKHYNDYDRNIILIGSSPFENFKIPKQEATRKRAISADLIRQIYKLPYLYNSRGKETQGRYNLAKDCFILSFCLIGINSADLYNCSELDSNVITYYRTKTTSRRVDKAKMQVKVPALIMPLLKKYRDIKGQRIFNFYHHYSTADSFNKAINYGLKEIGKLIGVDDLEYYAARHSWATLAVNKVGIDKYTVHSALNHIDEAMKVTDIYIERDFEPENEANRLVMEYVFGNGAYI
ncbi:MULTISPECIES: phage integrase SAM-like domain-containing protein [Phocaeicola]|uniref:Phage integrase SAM-like domain-containing protein n=1 Tax=Phocaeicola faecium TaxID=2762213 RepID=A0ABR8VDE7_9BACT|nr:MULTISPECIES: phage integrase SAM-like domain-containing protein [Phocaeicola]MBD8002791.1 phage integrase SAM-like domain-containing protein [Phocaeicola faecium]